MGVSVKTARCRAFWRLLGLPYTGSGVLASSVAMDKVATKRLLLHHGIATPAFAFIGRETTGRPSSAADQALAGHCQTGP